MQGGRTSILGGGSSLALYLSYTPAEPASGVLRLHNLSQLFLKRDFLDALR